LAIRGTAREWKIKFPLMVTSREGPYLFTKWPLRPKFKYYQLIGKKEGEPPGEWVQGNGKSRQRKNGD
jgi:hypothetical protein